MLGKLLKLCTKDQKKHMQLLTLRVVAIFWNKTF